MAGGGEDWPQAPGPFRRSCTAYRGCSGSGRVSRCAAATATAPGSTCRRSVRDRSVPRDHAAATSLRVVTRGERLRRLDESVLLRLFGPPRPSAGEKRPQAESVVPRFRFLTYCYAFLAALQVVLVVEGTGGQLLSVLLVVGFAGLSVYFRILWRRASTASG